MKKIRITVFEIICYIVAFVLFCVAGYLLKENLDYIKETMDQYIEQMQMYGMEATEEMFMEEVGSQVWQTLLNATVPYFAYAFLALAAGVIYHAVVFPKAARTEAEEETVAVAEDEALEVAVAEDEALEVAVAEDEVLEPAADEETVEAEEAKTEESVAEEKTEAAEVL